MRRYSVINCNICNGKMCLCISWIFLKIFENAKCLIDCNLSLLIFSVTKETNRKIFSISEKTQKSCSLLTFYSVIFYVTLNKIISSIMNPFEFKKLNSKNLSNQRSGKNETNNFLQSCVLSRGPVAIRERGISKNSRISQEITVKQLSAISCK